VHTSLVAPCTNCITLWNIQLKFARASVKTSKLPVYFFDLVNYETGNFDTTTTWYFIGFTLLLASMSSVVSNKQFDEQSHRTNRVPHGPETRAQGIPEQIVFRISGVPLTWTEDDVLNALKSVDKSRTLEVQKCHVTLYPACCGPFQIGLLNMGSSLKSFCDDSSKLELQTQDTVQYLFIDRHFYGLTPLNTPGNDVYVE
jgi:hypothetical protein